MLAKAYGFCNLFWVDGRFVLSDTRMFGRSALKIGPPSYSGPSNLTNVGIVPMDIQICVSGGCLPITGATAPATPPISACIAKSQALWIVPPAVNDRSPFGVIDNLMSRGFDDVVNIDTLVSEVEGEMFRNKIRIIPSARSSGRSIC